MSDNQYFAAKPPKECIPILEDRIKEWEDVLTTSGLLDKIRRSWCYYHGSFDEDAFNYDDHKVGSAGEVGELLKFPVNHYRNIGRHLINLITSNRPAMQARALNNDYKSTSQTILANGLLDYYMREKALEDILRKACEYAVVYSEGWIKMDWDVTAGDPVSYNEELKNYIYEGDIKYKALTPLEVVRDINKSDADEQDWLMVKSYKNKYDLAAKYPEFEKKLVDMSTQSNDYIFRLGATINSDSELIPVYEFYHRRSDALPDGRYILFVNKDIPLIDTPLPYRNIPCFKLTDGMFLGTNFGYTTMFDLLPIQEAINMLNSIIISNQNAFGVQNILVPRQSDINLSTLAGGLNIIDYLPGFGEPKALNLTSTPAEIFNHLQKLEGTMEVLSGVNQVLRGDPDPNLRSGSALALIQAQATQFAAGLQQSYVRLIENTGTSTITLLKDFADVPRVAAIVGKGNRTYLKEFKGDDLTNINRVVVDISNPISKTTAGKLQMATDLIQYQVIKTPEDYLSVLNTGNLDTMMQGQQNELEFIQQENEDLLDGVQVFATAVDAHSSHVKHHKAVLFDSHVRKNPEMVQAVLAHINEHISLLRETDPATLVMLGEQPIPPTPPQGAPPPPGVGPQAAGEGPAELEAPSSTPQELAQLESLPGIPTVPSDLLSNPAAQEASLGNVEES